MRILGIDASLRSTGLGVIEYASGGFKAVEYLTVKSKSSCPHSECLRRVHAAINELIVRTKPVGAAVEGGFFFKNAKTAMILGEVRGVVIAACAVHELPVYEYSPRDAKRALTGFGGAEKEQVCRMTMSILGLEEPPQEDAADALALAICHLQNMSGLPELRPKPI